MLRLDRPWGGRVQSRDGQAMLTRGGLLCGDPQGNVLDVPVGGGGLLDNKLVVRPLVARCAVQLVLRQ